MGRVLEGVVGGPVRNADDRLGPGRGDAVEFLHQGQRIADVLDQVRQQELVEAVVGEGQRRVAAGVDIGDDVDAGQVGGIEIDPARPGVAAAAHVEPPDGRCLHDRSILPLDMTARRRRADPNLLW